MTQEATVSHAVFISHSSADDAWVDLLRRRLEQRGIAVWVDSRALRGGDELAPAIEEGIRNASHFLLVLSPSSAGSPWVRRELALARESGKRVLPLLLPPLGPSALSDWFDEEPVAIAIDAAPDALDRAMPPLEAALGLRQPSEVTSSRSVRINPLADLIVEFKEPRLIAAQGDRGKRRPAARVRLRLEGAGLEPRAADWFEFVSPIAAVDLDDLSWYFQTYLLWPGGQLRERARELEEKLPSWGRALYDKTIAGSDLIGAWRSASTERRLSIELGIQGVSSDVSEATRLAACALLALPWELSRDARGYLFQGARPVRVRRRLVSDYPQVLSATDPPLRVLILSPRPEEGLAYIDHRISARPLVNALSALGSLASFKLLTPATFSAFVEELVREAQAGRPYHIVHFDGHGAHDGASDVGGLFFEHADDDHKARGRRTELVTAPRLAETLRDQGISLFFVEACESARADRDPITSVAAQLLNQGVASVVAMSHPVLVETTRRFIEHFYRELLQGGRVGQAMVAGQRALQQDRRRGRVFNQELELDDWFVPVLFQEHADPQLVRAVPADRVVASLREERRRALGEMPAPPAAGFKGRSYELLISERMLERYGYVVLRGSGGEGKTTLAAELAQWLVDTRRAQRAAFVSLEVDGNVRALVHAVGRQLDPGFSTRAGGDPALAQQLVLRALDDAPTVLVIDNFESVLAPADGSAAASSVDAASLSDILATCSQWAQRQGTRLIFTSRQPLPGEFAEALVSIGRLDRSDGLALAAFWMDTEALEEDVGRLVDLLGCHARSLVLVGRAMANLGLEATETNLRTILGQLPGAATTDGRERSLLASVRLSLDRLPSQLRDVSRHLGVFRGGASHIALRMFFNAPDARINDLAKALFQAGLADFVENVFLRWDPALALVVDPELTAAEREVAQDAWLSTYWRIAELLARPVQENVELASVLARQEMTNLVGALEAAAPVWPPEQTAMMAARLETILHQAAAPSRLERIASIRATAAAAMTGWSAEHVAAQLANVKRLRDAEQIDAALVAARQLLERSRAAGEDAYPNASHDLALSYLTLGETLRRAGQLEEALVQLAEAGRRFQLAADAGDSSAKYNLYVALGELATAQRALGRLSDAELNGIEALRLATLLGDERNRAVELSRLGLIFKEQGRRKEALGAFEEAKGIYERLGDSAGLAACLYNAGAIFREAGITKTAEELFLRAYRLRVERGDDRYGEALVLTELGNLYEQTDRLEDAVRFFADASKIVVEIGAARLEGFIRTNAARALQKLGRHDEARKEHERALELKGSFGPSSSP